MPAQWTGELIGKIHNAGLTIKDVSAEAGLNCKYVSTILNSNDEKLDRVRTRQKLENALDRLILKKTAMKEDPT